MTAKPKLSDIARVFLRLGATAFGGPAAHIAMMEEEIIRRRKWLTNEEFLDLMGATNLIPGPNSTELAIHIGHKVGGWKGLLTAGTLFIGPAFLIVWALAWFYVEYGSLPAFESVFLGVKPVILAIIAQAVWNLTKKAVKDRWLAVFAVLSLGLYLIWPNEILILLLIAAANLALRLGGVSPLKTFCWTGVLCSWLYPIQTWAAENSKVPLENVFLFFAKVGAVLFGSGYVLIAFLQSDLVDKHQWITQQQLVDAIAVGQFTPGPVFTTATFIGYLMSGHLGAVAGTVGIFLPAFFFVALSAPLVSRLRRSPWTAPVLDGLNVASLALMAGASLILAKDAAGSVYGVAAFAVSLIALLKFQINSVWLILVAGVSGLVGLAS